MQKKEYYKHNLPHFQQSGQAYFVTWSLKDAVPKHKLKHFTSQLEILKSQINSGLADEMGLADSNPPLESRIGIRETSETKPRIGVRDTQIGNPGLANSDSPLKKSRIGDGENQSRFRDRETQEKLKKDYNLLRKKYIKTYNDLLDVERKPEIDLSKTENTKVLIEAFKFWEAKKLKNHAFCIMPNHVHWVFELLENEEEGNPVYLQDILYSVKRFSATQINKLENRNGSLWQKESFDTTIRDEKHLYYVIEYTLNNPFNAGFVKDWKEWEGSWLAE